MMKEQCDRCPYSEKGYCLEHEQRCSEVKECKTFKRLQRTSKAIRQE
jgi:hypothetical protein